MDLKERNMGLKAVFLCCILLSLLPYGSAGKASQAEEVKLVKVLNLVTTSADAGAESRAQLLVHQSLACEKLFESSVSLT